VTLLTGRYRGLLSKGWKAAGSFRLSAIRPATFIVSNEVAATDDGPGGEVRFGDLHGCSRLYLLQLEV
jgi:hypothetical protein